MRPPLATPSERRVRSKWMILGSTILALALTVSCQSDLEPPMSRRPELATAISDLTILRSARALTSEERVQKLAALEATILSRVPQRNRADVRALLSAESALQPVASSDSITNRLLAEWHAVRRAGFEDEVRRNSRAEARTRPSSAQIVLDPSLPDSVGARILRRTQPKRLDLVIVGPHATAVDVAASLDLLQRMRADHGDDLLGEARATIPRARALATAPLTGTRGTRAAGLLAKLRAASPNSIDGLGNLRSIVVRLGRVKAP